ncbi:MAG: transcriptional regulator, partial [Brevundimonas sp.]|uniref:winged helix-turn-helix domain-containing protein n=1 Tax=Brevundimonas sp. TaxID=1871086 RepID=UPI0011FA29FA
MRAAAYRFDRFLLDPEDRRLLHDGAPVDLSARYFDALVLLVQERGRLVSKDRFLDEVWCGVPVTDEALTQCIRTLRRALGDDAGRPRLIETVPKHGYRFIGAVSEADGAAPPITASEPVTRAVWDAFFRLGRGGMVGGGAAGLVGGLLYGFVGVSDSLQPGGGVSALMVVVCLTAGVGLLGGAG